MSRLDDTPTEDQSTRLGVLREYPSVWSLPVQQDTFCSQLPGDCIDRVSSWYGSCDYQVELYRRGNLRLRSIPPRTMEKLRVELSIPGRVSVDPTTRLTSRSSLRGARPYLGRSTTGSRQSSSLTAPFITRPDILAKHTGELGRVYRQPAGHGRPTILLIPPRPNPAGGLPAHESVATSDGHLVRIVFPSLIGEGDLHWEQHGDVLDVECSGADFVYYYAFLVPPDSTPVVEQSGRTVRFHFAKAT